MKNRVDELEQNLKVLANTHARGVEKLNAESETWNAEEHDNYFRYLDDLTKKYKTTKKKLERRRRFEEKKGKSPALDNYRV